MHTTSTSPKINKSSTTPKPATVTARRTQSLKLGTKPPIHYTTSTSQQINKSPITSSVRKEIEKKNENNKGSTTPTQNRKYGPKPGAKPPEKPNITINQNSIDSGSYSVKKRQNEKVNSSIHSTTIKKNTITTNTPKYNKIETYEKTQGAIDIGKEFEHLMCTLFALKFVKDQNIRDFKMTSNNNSLGKFDDIEISANFENDTSATFLYQLKYKFDKEAITKKMLTQEKMLHNKKSKFFLPIYFESLATLRQKYKEKLFCFLYTTGSVDIKSGDILNFRKKNNNLNVVERCQIEHEDLVLNRANDQSLVFQFEPIVSETASEASEISIDSTCDDFYFLSGQQDIDEVKSNIKKILAEEVGCDIYESFLQFMRTWLVGDFVLTKHHIITKLTELALSPYIQTVSSTKCNEKTKTVEEAIMKFESTLVKDDNDDIVRHIWSEANHEIDFTQLPQIFEKDANDLSDSARAKILWFLGKTPLIVKMNTSNKTVIKNILKLLQKDVNRKRIILLGNHYFSRKAGILENLSHLKKHDQVYKNLLQILRVSIQGKHPLNLESLLKINKEFGELIEIKDLLLMSQKDFILIGHQKEEIPAFHIQRTLSTCVVNIEQISSLHNQKDVNLIIVSCNSEFKEKLQNVINLTELSKFQARKKVSKNEKLVLVSVNKNCSTTQFEEICRNCPTSNIYAFQQIDEDSCALIKKKGKSLSFKEDEYYEQEIKETELVNSFRNDVNLFCAPPGMGKSRMMKVLSTYCSPDIWTFNIDLINHNSFLAKTPPYETIKSHFLGLDCEDLTLKAKSLFLEQKKIVLFLDGLDEVDSTSFTTVVKFIKKLSSEGINIWLSSRENLREKICKSLYVVPIEINHLSNDQQKNYLVERLQQKYEKETLIKIVTSVITSSDITNSRELLGIPLQLHIIAEMFLNNEEAFRDLEKKDIFVLTAMYKLFFEGKIKSLWAKNKIDFSQITQLGENMENKLEQYEVLGLKACLDQSDFKKLDLKLSDSTKVFIRNVQREGDKIGIISKITESEDIIFDHQTFAEYFSCVWFKKNQDMIVLLKNELFSKRYENLRRIFDIMLAENNPLHLAVIYQNQEQFDEHFKESSKKDAGGRTAFHVACTYGLRFTNNPVFFVANEETSFEEIKFISYAIEQLSRKEKNTTTKDDLFDFNAIEYAISGECLHALKKISEILRNNKVYTKMLEKYSSKTLIYYAIKLGWTSLLKELLKNRNLKQIDDVPLFHYTIARKPHPETMLILKSHLSVDVEDRHGMTALHLACQKGYVETVKKLLEFGAYRKNALHFLCSSDEPNVEIANLLIEKDGDTSEFWKSPDQNGVYPLHLACQKGHLEIVQLLRKKGAIFNTLDGKKRNPLHYACDTETPNLKLIKTLMNYGVDKDWQDQEKATPLMIACSKGHVNVVKMLLQEYKVNIKTEDNNKSNALHYACDSSKINTEIVKLLLDNKVETDVQNNNGATPLLLACQKGHAKAVELLIGKGENSNCTSDILHQACATSKPNTEIINLLIRQFDINSRNKTDNTPLQIACEYGCIDNVKVLLKNGADVNIMDNNRKNSLHCAYKSQSKEVESIVKLLISNGIDINAKDKYGKAALQFASQRRHLDIVKTLLEKKVAVNNVDDTKQSALHFATLSQQNNSKIIDLLIRYGILVDAKNKDGRTALHLACAAGCRDNVYTLLQRNAKINEVDSENQNALHHVCNSTQPNSKIVALLINHSIDTSAKNSKGKTALQLAKSRKQFDIIEVLEEKRKTLSIPYFRSSSNVDFTSNISRQYYVSNTVKSLVDVTKKTRFLYQDGSHFYHNFFKCVHIAAIFGVYCFFEKAKWLTCFWALALITSSLIGILIGAQRLWAHQSFEAKLPLRIILAFSQTVAFQKSIYSWVKDHRAHHQFLGTKYDPYAVKKFLATLTGWSFGWRSKNMTSQWNDLDLSDLEDDKVVTLQHMLFWLVSPILAFVFPTYVACSYWDEDTIVAFLTCTVLHYLVVLYVVLLLNSFEKTRCSMHLSDDSFAVKFIELMIQFKLASKVEEDTTQ